MSIMPEHPNQGRQMEDPSWSLPEAQALDQLNQELEQRVEERTAASQKTIGTAQDLTEHNSALRKIQEYQHRLERANAELLQATRLKDEFLATMSHELRTPLNAILGQSETLQEELFGSLNERQHKSIATIERSGEKLLSLINDILEFSNIAAGKLELALTTVAVEDLCNSSLELVKEQAFKQQIKLIITLAPNVGDIQVDEHQIRRVLINLLDNAIKFTPTGGKVTLDVQLEVASVEPPDKGQQSLAIDTWLILSVTDTGIGISPENQSKLFQTFVQLDGNLNRQYEGTGLGLMFAKQLVELHGGAVSCVSAFGQGSCFTVRLPYCT
jgi:signal transduction histidine kinase